MWCGENLFDTIKNVLPPMAKIVVLEKTYKRPAVVMVDLDGDGVLELVGAYYWQGENYIVVLKYYYNDWYVADTIKGKGYIITYFETAPITNRIGNNLIVGWQVGAIWSDLSVYKLTGTALKDLIVGNRYYSMLDVEDIESAEGKDGIYELALWSHDTGKAYKVEIYRWKDNKFILALDVYPYYFKKVVNYYEKLLKEKDSTTYWYYLADAQIKIGNTQEAVKSIDKALSFEYPYPSREELIRLKEQILQHRTFSNQNGIDFSSIKYIYSETEKDVKLEKALVKAFELEQYEDNVRYYYNKVDLNEDGNPEIFAYLVGSPVCGTGGCSGAIFKQENGEYRLLSTFSLVNNPVIVSNSKTNGYRDIIMHVFGGGIESFFARVKYDGTTYPRNPSIQPKVEWDTKEDGIAIIADDITKNPGIKLENINIKNLDL
jgi:tetratricopeptide (TPR) repeat protein